MFAVVRFDPPISEAGEMIPYVVARFSTREAAEAYSSRHGGDVIED